MSSSRAKGLNIVKLCYRRYKVCMLSCLSILYAKPNTYEDIQIYFKL